MININSTSNNKISKHKSFDLEEKTAKFGENTIIFCSRLIITDISKPVINQLVRSSTSVGANYMEANGSDSKKDFTNKISICKKESKETCHWLRMLSVIYPNEKERLRNLWKESRELTLIFAAIIKKVKK